MQLQDRPLRLNSRDEVIALIENGYFDTLLSQMAQAIKKRRESREARLRAEIVELHGEAAALALDAAVYGSKP